MNPPSGDLCNRASPNADAATSGVLDVATAATKSGELASIWESIRADAGLVEGSKELNTQPLWLVPQPDWFRVADSSTRTFWQREPETWAFWSRWWDGVLTGRQIDWELQRRVALIPEEVWESGPEVVAKAIGEIDERLQLLTEVSAFRRELESLAVRVEDQASLIRRSHNGPPELIDLPAPIIERVTVLLADLRATEVELAKQVPAKALIRRLAAGLLSGAQEVIRYCLMLADTALQEGAKSVGKWAGGALAVYLGSEPVAKGLVALAEAILTHLAKYP